MDTDTSTDYSFTTKFVVLSISLIIGVRATCPERFYNNSRNCVKCPIHCKFCESTEVCLQCDNGYSGANCMDKCADCKPNTPCTKVEGFCEAACKDGLSGQYCNKMCATGCRSCARNDTSRCLTCKNYQTCESDCPEDCRSERCNGSEGSLCSNGCSPVYEGESCSRKCPDDCNRDTSGDQEQEVTDVPKPADEHNASVPVLLILIVMPLGVVLVILSVVLSVMLWNRRRSKHQRNVESKTNHSDLWGNMDDRNVDHEAQELNITCAEAQAEARSRESLYPYNTPFC